jgi:hypothetical protein
VNADADDVARRHLSGIDGIERLVDDVRIAPPHARRRGQHEQPARRDDGNPERHVARVDQMDTRGSGNRFSEHQSLKSIRALTSFTPPTAFLIPRSGLSASVRR